MFILHYKLLSCNIYPLSVIRDISLYVMGDLKVYGLRKCTQYVKVLCKKKKLNKKMTEKVLYRTTVGGAAAAAGGSECYAQGFLIFRRMLLLFHAFILILVTVYISFFQYLAQITNCPNPPVSSALS